MESCWIENQTQRGTANSSSNLGLLCHPFPLDDDDDDDDDPDQQQYIYMIVINKYKQNEICRKPPPPTPTKNCQTGVMFTPQLRGPDSWMFNGLRKLHLVPLPCAPWQLWRSLFDKDEGHRHVSTCVNIPKKKHHVLKCYSGMFHFGVDGNVFFVPNAHWETWKYQRHHMGMAQDSWILNPKKIDNWKIQDLQVLKVSNFTSPSSHPLEHIWVVRAQPKEPFHSSTVAAKVASVIRLMDTIVMHQLNPVDMLFSFLGSDFKKKTVCSYNLQFSKREVIGVSFISPEQF